SLAVGRVLLSSVVPLLALLAPPPARAAFGYSDNGVAYVVDTGAGLVFQVDKTSGDIASIVFNGVEYKGPSGKGTHIASGLGSHAWGRQQPGGATSVSAPLQPAPDTPVGATPTPSPGVRGGETRLYGPPSPPAGRRVGELR